MMIRKMIEKDRTFYLDMVKKFYSSDAVCHCVPEKNFSDTFDELMRSDRYVIGYMMEYDGRIAGYALLAKMFSQEAGGMVWWIDELYVLPGYRGRGLGHEFFSYLSSHLGQKVKRVRLEVKDDNAGAKSLYKKMGFKDLPYSQMVRDYTV